MLPHTPTQLYLVSIRFRRFPLLSPLLFLIDLKITILMQISYINFNYLNNLEAIAKKKHALLLKLLSMELFTMTVKKLQIYK